MKRSRGRNRRPGGSTASTNHSNPNRHYESVGPDVKIRGSAQQVLEKYQQYARDAQTSGDRVLSEAYFQFAEHYQRIVAKQLEAKERQQQPRGGRDDRDNRRDDRDDRDNRNESSDEDSSDDRDQDTRSGSQSRSRRDEESRDDRTDSDKPDSLKVIDASEETLSGPAVAEQPSEPAAEKPEGERPKSRRKPYRSREASAEPEAVTDGVMKTLSRGRKKAAASEETVSVQDASAETTD